MSLNLKLFLLPLVLLPPSVWSAEQIVKEKIAVVNVEVPVRVFLDGAPVAGLRRDDFRLFEDREEQTIYGFNVRHKKLAVQKIDMKPGAGSENVPGRYFVLVFRIIEFNEQMKKGIDYFFEHILRDNDQLLVMVNNRTLVLDQDVWQIKRRELVNQVLNEEATIARQDLQRYFLAVQQDLDLTKLNSWMERNNNLNPRDIINLLEKYMRTWDEFKIKYLVPDLDKFYNFARHLEKIKKEKWVFSFFQIEMFPSMKLDAGIRLQIANFLEEFSIMNPEGFLYSKIINQLFERIDRRFNVASDFPTEEVSKMLVKVDTTYHSFIMGVQRESMSEDLEYKKVASDIQNSLREIALQSGGEVIFSGDIGSALHSIVEREDISYVLTYEPKNPVKKGKVGVVLTNPKCNLFYDDNVRADYIGDYLMKKKAQDPTLQMNRLQWIDKQLQLEVFDFKMTETAKGPQGNLRVTVRIRGEQNQPLYDQNRTFLAKKKQVSLAIDFSWLKAGKYVFLVEVRDLLSEKTAMDILQATVD